MLFGCERSDSQAHHHDDDEQLEQSLHAAQLRVPHPESGNLLGVGQGRDDLPVYPNLI